jgi:hypothetical protein
MVARDRHSLRYRSFLLQLTAGVLMVWASAANSGATAVNVYIDPAQPWNGFENIFYQNGSFWTNSYFPPGSAGVIQGSIGGGGLVTCAPDIRMDRDFHFNTNAWADASGTSPGICRVLSTFYIDSTTVAHAGDTVTFSGVLASNTLAAPYSTNIVAFIKDFDANYGNYGMASVGLITPTNGQAFSISKTITAPGTNNHIQWGFEWSGPPARSNNVGSLGQAVLVPLPAGTGAAVPWTTYEAENMTISGGTILGPGYQPNFVATEASGRRCVQLNATGQFIQFKAQAAANSVVVRYSVPDTPDGAGADYTLSLYRNGSFVQKLAVSSRYSWLYGAYSFNNNPASGSPRNFYDEVRVIGLSINAGDQLRLEKDVDDAAANYVIDLVDLENVAPQLTAPAGSVAITNSQYGAVGDGITDCTSALQNCINDAQAQGKKVWLPAGSYLITGNISLPDNTTVQGEGMWYSRLVGSAALYNTAPSRRLNLNGMGSNIHLADFAIVGCLNYRNDSEGNDGLGGAYGTNSSISRIWVEHTKAAAWILNSRGLLVDSCRFRNTLADGINVNMGMRSTVVTNCTARGTGDDGFAIWPAPGTQTYAPGLNVITHCTAQTPFLANGGAIYGGESNRIEDCLFQDIPYLSGVLLSTTFPVSSNFSGTTVVQRCDLNRCGGTPADPSGGLQICLQYRGISNLNLNHLNIDNNVTYGLSVIFGAGALSNATMSRVTIPNYGLAGGGGHALWARNDALGSMTVSNCAVVEFHNDSPNFTFRFLPPAQPILNISFPGGTNVSLSYATTPGYTYHVESASNLSPASWVPFPGSTTNAVGALVNFTTPTTGNGQRFFRTVSP